MQRTTLLALGLLVLVGCGAPDSPAGPSPDPADSRDVEGGETTDGLPARADCAGAQGTVALALPTPSEDAELTVFAVTALDASGLPAGAPVSDVVIGFDPLEPGGPFPVSYRICVPPGPHVLLAALDAQGDREVLGAGDYVGQTEVTIPEEGVVEANITLDRALGTDQAKKGDKPPEESGRRRRR